MRNSPIAVTGMGAVTAQGVGVEATWAGVVAGREVLRPWEGLAAVAPEHPLRRLAVAQCGVLAPVRGMPERLWGKLSRTQQLAVVAAEEAVGRAGLIGSLGRRRVGIFLATTVCGMDVNERFYAQYREGKEGADVELMRRLQPYETTRLVARRLGVEAGVGLEQTCLTTCVGSAMAIGNAADAIALGECDVAIAGGAEALCRVVLSGFHALKVVAPEGCRPFDLGRPGMTVGEGAGVLVMESMGHARGRGAEVLATLNGFGVTCDAHHLTAPEPHGTFAAMAIEEALQRAGAGPGEIGYINAHGTGTRDNDVAEGRAIGRVFGEKVPPVSSTKRMTGHTFGAAAAIEAIVCVQALRTQTLPPNGGTRVVDPAIGLPLVREARGAKVETALSTNFAFGGNNTAMVFAAAGGG